MIKRLLSLMLILSMLILSMLLPGCGSGTQENVPYKSDSGTGLNVALNNIPTTMDPQLSGDVTSTRYLEPAAGLLYRVNEDAELFPELAESYELSEDALTYTFHLKDGIRYSNGRSVKARDFVYAFRRIADPAEASPAIFMIEDICKIKNVVEVNTGVLPVEELGVSAPDDRTFVVELAEPCPYFLYILADPQASPCSEEFVKSCNGRYATSPETMLSCGPFMVDRYEPLALQVHYSKNPYFVDADKVRLPEITFRQVQNVQQAEMVYQAGEADIIEVGGDYFDLSRDDPDLHMDSGGGIFFIMGNYNTSEEYANRNIRIAIAKAIDRDSIVQNYLHSNGQPLSRIIPSGFCKEPDGTDFGGDTGRYYDVCGYEPEKALLYWKAGLAELNVSSLTIRFKTSSSNQKLAEILKSQLEGCLPGLTLDITLLSGAQYLDDINRRNFEIMLTGWGANYPDPTTFLNIMLGDSFANSGNYKNAEFDSIMNKSLKEKDAAERMKLLHDAEDILMRDLPIIPIYASGDSWLIKGNVKGAYLKLNGIYIDYTYAEKR